MSYEPAPSPYDPETPRPPAGPPVSPGPYGYQQPPMSPAPYGYQQPYPVQPVVVVPSIPTSGVSVASMVLGIIGALGGWCMLGIPCAAAIITGHLGLTATKDGRQSGRGMAVAGLILGYIFVVPWAIVFFTSFLGMLLGGHPTPAPTPTP